MSSSDGLRLPMRGKSLTARALSRYFLDQGVTTYLWVSDQHTTYGTQIIVPTERDGLFTLDELLGKTTELPIVEHATDTHGQLLVTFALYDLVGLTLSPRIAKLTERQLWRPHPPGRHARWPRAGPLLEHHAQVDLIAGHWDELLRVAGSVKPGYVSASLLVAKLQAGSQDPIDAERADGREVSDEAIGHLSPAHFESINPYRTHTIDVAAVLNRAGRDPSGPRSAVSGSILARFGTVTPETPPCGWRGTRG